MPDYRLKKRYYTEFIYVNQKLTININTWTKTKKREKRKRIITLKSGKCCLQQHVNTNDHQFAVCIKCWMNNALFLLWKKFCRYLQLHILLPSFYPPKNNFWSEFTFMMQIKYTIKKTNMGNEKSCVQLTLYRIWYK